MEFYFCDDWSDHIPLLAEPNFCDPVAWHFLKMISVGSPFWCTKIILKTFVLDFQYHMSLASWRYIGKDVIGPK